MTEVFDLHEGREDRADRWVAQRRSRLLGSEPDWWLRLACGHVVDEGIVTALAAHKVAARHDR